MIESLSNFDYFQLWFLNGLSSFLNGPDFYGQARSDFKKAKRVSFRLISCELFSQIPFIYCTQFSTTPHGVCYDIVAQCDEHLSTIAGVLPVDEADSDDEDEEAPPVGSGNPAEGVTISEEPDGSDWETDEESCPDVEMA
jgi:hypothetical protein